MLEDLISPERMLDTPLLALFHGILAAFIGSLLAMAIYPAYAGLLAVTFTTLALVHIMHHILLKEVEYDETLPRLERILVHHGPLIQLFLMVIIGLIIGYTLAGILMPTVLNVQTHEVQQIRALTTGQSIHDLETARFMTILGNNIRVLLVAAVLGFAYGYAGIFLLAWNASLVAAAGLAAWRSMSGRLQELPLYLAVYLPHGLVEFAAYFLGAVSLSILGIALARRDWEHPAVLLALTEDAGSIFLVAVLLVVLGAVLEVWVTPLLIA